MLAYEGDDDELGRCAVCGAAGSTCMEEAMGVTVDRTATERSSRVVRSGGVTITYAGGEGETPMHTLAERTYVNKDSTKVVPEGSVDAAFLLGNAGDEISAETAERLGLTKKAKDADSPSYGSMKKAEIVKLADKRGVDSTGTIAEIATLLEADDEKAKEAEVGAGGAGGTADQGDADATASVGSPEADAATSSPA